MKLTKSFAKVMRKHGGTILAVAASVGVVLMAVETGKATVKAEKLIEMNKDVPDYGTKEKVMDCYKFYIPAAVLGAGTIACILGSNALNRKQIASLTAAYMALGKTYQEYRQKVVENIGVEKEAEIREQIKEDKSAESTENGAEEKILCYEPFSNRYFHATMTDLYDAFYHLNREFALEGYTSLNDLFNYLGLDFIPEKDNLGWCCDYLANEWEYYWIDFCLTPTKTDDGLEVYEVSAYEPPIHDYLDYDPANHEIVL